MTVSRKTRLAGAGCGILAAGAGLGSAEGVAALLSVPSPVVAVGQQMIDLAPPFLKDFAVETFGENDKGILVIGVVATLGLVAALAGAIGVTRRNLAVAMAAGLGVVGLIAAYFGASVAVPLTQRLLPGLAALLVSAGGLSVLLRAFDGEPANSTGSSEPTSGVDRRKFLGAAAAIGAIGVLGAGIASFGRRMVDISSFAIPTPTETLPPMPAGVAFTDIEGLTPFLTPLDEFYRVDTALSVPQVDPTTWQLRIHGMVDKEITLTYDQLLARDLVERDITLTCVSNEVGGPYVGNARWTGTSIQALLEEAGVQDGADAVLSTSTDGMTIGTPIGALTDGRDAIIAVGMNGQPLPADRGFPARMVVPGLYGYVSATKWLVDMEITRFADFEAYWTPRGWAEEAPIKISSRIDVPGSFQKYDKGQIVIAGVAWAQNTGVEGVEVSIDGGEWQAAELSDELSVDTWRQWRYTWDGSGATSGSHEAKVRAIGQDGETQTEEQAPPRPNGASGWHGIVFGVN